MELPCKRETIFQLDILFCQVKPSGLRMNYILLSHGQRDPTESSKHHRLLTRLSDASHKWIIRPYIAKDTAYVIEHCQV